MNTTPTQKPFRFLREGVYLLPANEMETPLYLSLLNAQSRAFPRGFLPPRDPLIRLPHPFETWEQTADVLSKLALSRYIRPALEDLPPFQVQALQTLEEFERAMSMLSFMANMYVFAPDHPVASGHLIMSGQDPALGKGSGGGPGGSVSVQMGREEL